MNLLIVGASAGLGRALATEAARRGHDLLLVASDERDLHALANHLHLLYGGRVECLACHVGNPSEAEQQIVAASKAFSCIHGLLFPLGYASDGDNGSLSAVSAERLVDINFLSIAAVTNAFWNMLLQTPEPASLGLDQLRVFAEEKEM